MTNRRYIVLAVLFIVSAVQAKTTVSGRITGYDGKPIPLANVLLTSPNADETLGSTAARKSGEYSIVIESKGIWLLHFSGVHHQDRTVAVYAESQKDVHLDVRLATYDYGTDYKQLKVIGNFNNWYPPSAVPMRKGPGETYVADIITKKKRVLYQLTGIVGRGLAGTAADEYAFNPSHGYDAALTARDGRVRIVFDPDKLPVSGKAASIRWGIADSTEARFAAVYDEMQAWNHAYRDSLIRSVPRRRAGLKGTGFDFKNVLSALRNEIREEPNRIVRRELHLMYFMFASKGGTADSMVARELLEEIPPESIVWSLAPGNISYAFDYSKYDEARRDSYVQRVIDKNPSAETVSFLLSNEFTRALYMGEKAKATMYYDIAVNQYGDTPGGKEVAHYHNLSAVDPGKVAPEFLVEVSHEPHRILNNEQLKGRYFLLYFWATWDKASIAELRNLERAYKRFGGARLTVISLSLDSSRQDLERFQKVHGKLPWLSTLVGDGFRSAICKAYEVYSIPKPILVDPKGRIAAVGMDLRGTRLRRTLARFLDK